MNDSFVYADNRLMHVNKKREPQLPSDSWKMMQVFIHLNG
jgi:hypothetical protein